jgi:heat shock protein HslJ
MYLVLPGGWPMMYLRIFGAICVLAGVFLFGMWLTWPEFPYNPSGFPIGRNFLAVSLNDEPLIRRDMRKLATLEVRGRSTFRHRAGGRSLCNEWGGQITFLPARRILWGTTLHTAAGCTQSLNLLEEKYLKALLSASRWRTEEGNLILENGTDVVRFQPAPP